MFVGVCVCVACSAILKSLVSDLQTCGHANIVPNLLYREMGAVERDVFDIYHTHNNNLHTHTTDINENTHK